MLVNTRLRIFMGVFQAKRVDMIRLEVLRRNNQKKCFFFMFFPFIFFRSVQKMR